MSNYSKCQEKLVAISAKQGYLTFDDILNESEAFSLSVSEVDFLSEAIQLRGIIVYEEKPQLGQPSQEDEDVLDYSRTNYAAIFEEILDMAPQLEPLITQVRASPAPQWGEVDQLARQIAEGNKYARERSVMLYMRSVLKIALSMTKQYELDIEDAISAGFIGLINAVDRYDPSGFSAFNSYASLWIQQSIQRECIPVWMDYYFPAHYKDAMCRSLQKYNKYSTGDYEDPEDYRQLVQRIAREIELPENYVDKVLINIFKQKHGKLCLETIIELESNEDCNIMPELVISDEDIFETIFGEDLKLAIRKMLSLLTPREALVIRMRKGIDYASPMTLEKIGLQLHLTRERVRQIEAKALRKLSRAKYKEKLREYQ